MYIYLQTAQFVLEIAYNPQLISNVCIICNNIINNFQVNLYYLPIYPKQLHKFYVISLYSLGRLLFIIAAVQMFTAIHYIFLYTGTNTNLQQVIHAICTNNLL